jgi:hypothetical protein
MNRELINEYYLERYVLGELPGEVAEEIRRQVSASPVLQAALRDIESSNHDILARYSAPSVKADLKARMNEVQSRRTGLPLRSVLYLSSAVATVLVFFLLILPAIKHNTEIEPLGIGQDQTLVKGIPAVDLSKTQLLIFRKSDDLVEIMADREWAKTGDLLQLAYVAAKESYGVILSIDGRGRITLHFPAEKGGATELEQHRESLLPNAIELDDAPDFERFFFVTSREQIDVEDVLKRAENLAKDPKQIPQAVLDLPDGLKQYTILVLKGEGR